MLTEEEYQMIEDLSAANFAPDRIAIILELNKRAFRSLYFDTSTEVYRRVQKGKTEAQANIAVQLKTSATKGNITAIQQFAKMQDQMRIDELRQKYFG